MFEAFKADIRATCGCSSTLRLIARVLVFPQARALAYYRLGHFLAGHGMLILAYMLRSKMLKHTGAEINPLATIGPGLNLMHTAGVVIGADVVIGKNATIYQGVTLGHGPKPGQPRVGDDVFLSAGVKVLGGVIIGSNVTIGPNVIIFGDVPSNSGIRQAASARAIDNRPKGN